MNTPTETTRYQFTIRLKGGATKPVTAIRRTAGGAWTIKPKFAGKKVFRSLGVVGETKDDLALVRKRAQAILQDLDDRRYAPAGTAPEPTPKPASYATIGQVVAAYKAGIALETQIRARTVQDNASTLRRLVRDGLLLTEAEADAQPVTVLTREMIERWQDAAIRRVQHEPMIIRGRTRRSLDGAVLKARCLFTDHALAAYRKAGLTIPDLTGFHKAPMKGNWNPTGYTPIADATIAAMDAAAWGELRAEQPGTFLTYLLMLRLGLRNSEVAAATRDWIEHGTATVLIDGRMETRRQAYFAVLTRPGWEGPKNGKDRRVPIAPDVLAEIEALAGPSHILPGTAYDRRKTANDAVCDFVRRFLPAPAEDGSGRVKAAYELRKHFGAVVASTQGLDRAAEYLGDRMETVERHYHAWLQGRSARPMHAEELVPRIVAASVA